MNWSYSPTSWMPPCVITSTGEWTYGIKGLYIFRWSLLLPFDVTILSCWYIYAKYAAGIFIPSKEVKSEHNQVYEICINPKNQYSSSQVQALFHSTDIEKFRSSGPFNRSYVPTIASYPVYSATCLECIIHWLRHCTVTTYLQTTIYTVV